jgi:hypothetical protein
MTSREIGVTEDYKQVLTAALCGKGLGCSHEIATENSLQIFWMQWIE